MKAKETKCPAEYHAGDDRRPVEDSADFSSSTGGAKRFSELSRALTGVTQKMLTQQLGRWSATAWSRGKSTRKCRRKSSTR